MHGLVVRLNENVRGGKASKTKSGNNKRRQREERRSAAFNGANALLSITPLTPKKITRL
jgi:hypothetical protein